MTINIPLYLEIIIEIILAAIAFFLSERYWRYLHSPKIFFGTLKDYEKLKLMYSSSRTEIKDFLYDRTSGGYEKQISFILDNIIKEFRNEKNSSLIGLIIVELLGFLFLGWFYGALILAIYFIVYLLKLSGKAERNINRDITIVMHGISEWYKIYPDDCREFCNRVYPKLLKTIYKVVAENRI